MTPEPPKSHFQISQKCHLFTSGWKDVRVLLSSVLDSISIFDTTAGQDLYQSFKENCLFEKRIHMNSSKMICVINFPKMSLNLKSETSSALSPYYSSSI